jgi:uncharacterized Zn-finger protein
MTPKTFLQGPKFQKIVLLVWLVSAGLVIFSQKNVDSIVNVTLYNYHLQFSNNWAQPYWNYEHLLYASEFVSIALTVVALASGFLKKDTDDKHPPKRKETSKKSVVTREETKGRNIVVSCSNCKRVFSKPLVMLDFSGGKAKLVNVCPYCNTVLEKAEKQNDAETIVNPEKEIQEEPS